MYKHNKVKQVTLIDPALVNQAVENLHTSIEHSGKQQLKCPFCDYAGFMLKHTMLRHVRIHSSEKQFSCSSCPTKFADIDGKKRHEKNKHPEVKLS